MTTRTKAILSLSGIFLVGAICGAAVVGLIVRDRVVEMQSMRERDGFIKIFADRLHLTEAQRDSLRDELAQTYEELHALRRAAAAEYGEVFDTLESRIGPKLTPEQRDILHRQEERVLPGAMRDRRAARGPEVPPARAPQPTMPPPDTVEKDTVATPPAAPLLGRNRPARPPLRLQSPKDSTGAPADTSEEAIARRLLAEIVDAYRTKLALNDVQTGQVRRIVTHFLRRSRDIRDNSFGIRERSKRLKVNFRLMHVRIYEDVLTDEQRKLYPEMPFEVFQIIKRYLPRREGARPE